MAVDEKKLIEYLVDMEDYLIRQKKCAFLEPEEEGRLKGQITFIAGVLSKIDAGEFA